MNKKKLHKLLIVDDDEDILAVVQAALEPMVEVEIQYAFSGIEALNKLESFIPDLIIMDVLMPKMGGIETLQLMKKEPFLQEIPVVFFTARVQLEELALYKRLDVFDVLLKPFNAPKLPETIERIWDRYTETI